MKNVFFVTYNPLWTKKIDELQQRYSEHTFVYCNNLDEFSQEIQDADTIVSGRISQYIVHSAPQCKAIFIPWTGVNHLPFSSIQEKGILVGNTHANAGSVAEKAFSLCLSLMGRVTEYDRDLRKALWHRYSLSSNDGAKWISLQNKTIGYIGFGAIGKQIFQFCLPFTQSHIVYKRTPLTGSYTQLATQTHNLDELLEKSKVIFISLPTNKETENIINYKRCMSLHGKYIINVGRGLLINEQGLYDSLHGNILAGAGIDTWYMYPKKQRTKQYSSRFPFHTLDNVVLSPHCGSFSDIARKQMIQETIDNLTSFLEEQPIPHPVDLVHKY